jgi:hypothetical protein
MEKRETRTRYTSEQRLHVWLAMGLRNRHRPCSKRASSFQYRTVMVLAVWLTPRTNYGSPKKQVYFPMEAKPSAAALTCATNGFTSGG